MRRSEDRILTTSTDCGLGLRCHPQIAWANKALSEGARLAGEKLWNKRS